MESLKVHLLKAVVESPLTKDNFNAIDLMIKFVKLVYYFINLKINQRIITPGHQLKIGYRFKEIATSTLLALLTDEFCHLIKFL
jgi:hypothetical protein